VLNNPRTLSLAVALGCLSAPALAGTPVLVSEFQALDDSSVGYAALLRTYLSDALAGSEEIDVVAVEDAPDYGEYSALVYLQSCPPGETTGCAWVVGQAAGAEYALTGTVEATARGNRVELVVVNVTDTREALSFGLEVEVGEDEAFVAGIADLLEAVIRGEAGLSEDIREVSDDPYQVMEEAAAFNALIAAELEALQEQLGADIDLADLTGRSIDRPKYTLEELTAEMGAEGAKPWERLDMSPNEYLRYKNSGMTLPRWREAAAGRQWQLILRPAFGLHRGLLSASYYGHYALESEFLSTVETYAWQSLEPATGGRFGGWLGFGVHPAIEVSVGAGVGLGRYSTEILVDQVQEVTVGTYEVTDEDPRDCTVTGDCDLGWTTSWMGARVVTGLLPVKRARPMLGGGVVLSRAPCFEIAAEEAADRGMEVAQVCMPELPTEELPIFDRLSTLELQALVGVEASAGDNLDFYLLVPLGVVVGGNLSGDEATGVDVIPGKREMTAPGRFTVGVEIGIAVRLFGKEDFGGDGPMEFEDFDY